MFLQTIYGIPIILLYSIEIFSSVLWWFLYGTKLPFHFREFLGKNFQCKIFRAISTTLKVNTTLQILDSPGFQDPISVHPKGHGASFEDLCFNYACEKLHWFLHFATFTNQLDRYNRVRDFAFRDFY